MPSPRVGCLHPVWHAFTRASEGKHALAPTRFLSTSNRLCPLLPSTRMTSETKHTKHKTCHRYNEPGHAHLLTFSCFKGRPFLSKDRTRFWLIESLDCARHRLTFDVWAYVIMPEHAHVLLLPRQRTYSISQILAAVKI